MSNRGQINNYARARQQRDYSGLRYGNITPTDIDGYLEYQDKAHIFIELKHGDAPFPFGQQLAYKRLIQDLVKAGKPAVCIIANHDVDDPAIDIDAAKAIVSEYLWWKQDWTVPPKQITVKSFLDKFLQTIDTFPYF